MELPYGYNRYRPGNLTLSLPNDTDAEDNLAKSPIARNLGHYPLTPRSNHETEYKRTLEVSKAPDIFPCKHVLCHHCLRKNIRDNVVKCPICGTTTQYDAPSMEYGVSGAEEDNNNTMLVTNFDEIVKKFRGIDRPSTLRRMKEDSVQTATIGMTYTSIPCDVCEEDHGNLKVLQELNKLSVVHKRPDNLNGHYYRLCMGDVVTTFYSKVNSSSICVPCTYKGLRKSQQFHELTNGNGIPPEDASTQLCLAEVGKLIVKKSAPTVCMQGKNMIEVDHTISVKNRADLFDFNYTAERIQKMVGQQENTLIKQVTRQINDNGKLYHIKESSNIDLDDDPTLKTEIW